MQCQKCGSNYASIQKTESKDGGVTIQTIYCAECKNTYEVRIENPPLQGFKQIMTVNTNTIIGLYNGKIGILDTNGQYSFHPKGMIRFSCKGPRICFGFQEESPKFPQVSTGFDVRNFKIEPEFEANLLNSKAYQLKDEALKGLVPELSADLVKLLNDMLVRASGNKRILLSEIEKNPSKYKDNNGCYIATSVYGSYDCPQVWTLRRYRDYTLAETWYGMAFIRTYYTISPTIVKWFGKTKWFNNLWRKRLDRLVNKLKSMGIEDTPYRDRF